MIQRRESDIYLLRIKVGQLPSPIMEGLWVEFGLTLAIPN
jgi:hypothetical protein